MKYISIHPHFVVDINKEKITEYGYQIGTSADSDRQIRIV